MELATYRGLPILGFDRDQLDITKPDEVERLLAQTAPRLVINAAAYTAVDRAEREPERAHAVNADGPGHLARLCRERGIPLLHVSTDYVFDGRKGAPYTPADTPRPINVYGESKLAGENLIRNILPSHIILRTSWVFGRHSANFVKTVLRLVAEGNPLRIVNDQRGAPTSSLRLADCLLDMADRYLQGAELPWGTHHFTGSPYATWYEFAQQIIQHAVALNIIKPVTVAAITTDELQLAAARPADTRLAGQILANSQPDWRQDVYQLLTVLSQTDKQSAHGL